MTKGSLEGGCLCGEIRYRLEDEPIFTHCCHCTWCQRETGSAFAINAMIERDKVTLLSGEPIATHQPTASGRPHPYYRCPTCLHAVWSHYGSLGELLAFVRVSTLDKLHHITPDAHIYTTAKVPWVELPADAAAYEEFYPDAAQLYSAQSLDRLNALKRRARA